MNAQSGLNFCHRSSRSERDHDEAYRWPALAEARGARAVRAETLRHVSLPDRAKPLPAKPPRLRLCNPAFGPARGLRLSSRKPAWIFCRTLRPPRLSARTALAPGPQHKREHGTPETSNFISPPAEPGVYQNEIEDFEDRFEEFLHIHRRSREVVGAGLPRPYIPCHCALRQPF